MLQLMLQPTPRLTLQQMLQLMLSAMSSTTHPTYRGTSPQTQDTMQELSLLRSKRTTSHKR
jgi:hypothetical protein